MTTKLIEINGIQFTVSKKIVEGSYDQQEDWTFFRGKQKLITISETACGSWYIGNFFDWLDYEDNDFNSPTEALKYFLDNEF